MTVSWRPLAELCEDLARIASDLHLPGRPLKPTGIRDGKKKGWAAPSAEVLQLAFEHMPNAPGGPFSDRTVWITAAHAFKGAAIATGCEPDARGWFLEWCEKWEGEDPDSDAAAWDGIAQPSTGWGSVMRFLEHHNPVAAEIVGEASARAHYEPIEGEPASGGALVPISSAELVATLIPPRPYLYAQHITAGFVSLLVAPGGAGKTSLMVTQTLAMVTGQPLLGEKVHRPLRVWVHNQEDDLDEMNRRFSGAMKHFGISHADLGDRLARTSGRTDSLCLARQRGSSIEIAGDEIASIEVRIKEFGADVFILDPFGAAHQLPENSNEAINALLGAIRQMAHRTKCAIHILHHASKFAANDMANAGAGASRGASALVDGARNVRQIAKMTKDEAKAFRITPELQHLTEMNDEEAVDFGVPGKTRHNFFRVDNGKSNLAPAAGAQWIELVSVRLENGTPDYPQGDSIGVTVPWQPPKPQAGTPEQRKAATEALRQAPEEKRRCSIQADDWAGYVVADALGWDIGQPRANDRTAEQESSRNEIKAILARLLRDGIARKGEGQGRDRKMHPIIEIVDTGPADKSEGDIFA